MGTYRHGWVRVYTGCMSSGKTEEVFRQLRRHEIAGKRTLLVKHAADSREPSDCVSSRNGQTREPVTVASPLEILEAVAAYAAEHGGPPDVVAVEEAQFFDRVFVDGLQSGGFDPSLLGVVRELSERGINVYATGLNQDFRGEPFLLSAALMAVADEAHTLTAVCKRCGRDATRSHRLVQGRPAPYGTPRFLPGWDEDYEARCIDCHDVPGRPPAS